MLNDDGFGRVATVTDGNGNTLTYTYDLADRITKQAYTGGAKTLTVSYAYDGAGNLKTQTSSACPAPPATPTTAATRCSRSALPPAAAPFPTPTTPTATCSRLRMAPPRTGTYGYNTLDQLTSLTDPTGAYWQFSYNAAEPSTHTYYGAPAGQTANYQVKDPVR